MNYIYYSIAIYITYYPCVQEPDVGCQLGFQPD
jgi:hypothetical protein